MFDRNKNKQMLLCAKDKDRIQFIDFAKALAIIMVLALHNNIASSISTMFVLPVFFVASGMLFFDSGRSYKDTIIRYIKKLIIPFWLMMLIIIPFEMVRASILGYGDSSVAIPALINTVYGNGLIPDVGDMGSYLKQIMSYKDQSLKYVDVILPMNCHLWFLPAMFCAQVITLIVIRTSKRLHIAFWIPVLFLLSLVEYINCVPPLPYCLTRGFLGAAYMLVGLQFTNLKVFETKNYLVSAILVISSCAVTYFANSLGAINTLWISSIYGPNGINSAILAFLAGVCSSYIVLKCFYLFEHLTSALASLKKLLSLISIHSITIYLWHLIVFNIIYALYIWGMGQNIHLDQYKMSPIYEAHWFFLFLMVVFTTVFLTYAGVGYKYLKNKKSEQKSAR